jgi:hypothetical protein
MNGWMRQKNVYVPTGRFFGVFQTLRFAAGVLPAGP